MSRWVMVRCGVLAVALAFAGCHGDTPRGIEGEWMLRLDVVEPGNAPGARPGQRLQGTLVIDPGIPDVYFASSERVDSLGFVPGRVYLDRRPLFDSAGVQRPYVFRPELVDDIFEEALARVDSSGAFEAVLTPGVSHNAISLQGRQSTDTITGHWVHDAYVGEVGPRGTFQMRRIRRTAATDSALARSRRARVEWERNSR